MAVKKQAKHLQGIHEPEKMKQHPGLIPKDHENN